MTQYPYQFTETYSPDQLIAGETPLASRTYTLAAGQVVKRGTVMGQVTATGKLVVSTTAATDGSQNPMGIVYDDYDATAGDLGGCGVYEAGQFNANAVTLGAGWTVANIHAALRDAGIYLKPVLTAAGTNFG